MKTIRLRAVGDNLPHKQICEAARQADGSYCFIGMYDRVKTLIREADIAVINQETILVEDPRKVSSFPSFGSPLALGDAIVDAGFDVVTHATNHALDKGYPAIKNSADFWESRHDRILCAGIHTSREDYEKIRILERGGIRVAILNYTALLNYHPVPVFHSYCVDRMKAADRSRIRRQLREARSRADIVAVFPHWGCEYLYEPIPKQMEWASFFAENGADVIIGTHPHVLQNTGILVTKDGRKVPCLYSLGNFLSCQVFPGTMLGGMADVVIEKDGEGHARVASADIIPLVTHTDENYSRFEVYPLSEYTDALAAENKIAGIISRKLNRKVNTEYLWELYRRILRKEALRESSLKTPADVRRMNLRYMAAALRGKTGKE